jgi:hypothetical protein
VPRLRISGAIPLLLPYAFMACRRATLSLPLNISININMMILMIMITVMIVMKIIIVIIIIINHGAEFFLRS